MTTNIEQLTQNIKEFYIEDMKKNYISYIYGPSNSGKSILCRDILYHHSDVQRGIVCSINEERDNFYSSFIQPKYVFNEYSPLKVKQFIEYTRKIRNKEIKYRQNNDIWPTSSYSFCVMDDCLYDKANIYDINIKDLYFNGRSYNIMTIITSHYSRLLPPMFHTNTDYIFLLGGANMNDKQRLWKIFDTIFNIFNVFNDIYDYITTNYGVMVIDNKIKSNKIKDVVFWYRANASLENFKIYCNEEWIHDEKEEQQTNNDINVEKIT